MTVHSSIRLFAAVAALAIIGTGTTGCAWEMFESYETIHVSNVSCGQELIDLQEAKAKGAVSEAEYLKLRGQILKSTETETHKKQSRH